MTEHLDLAAALVRHHLKTPQERIEFAEGEIAAARSESDKSHTQDEHIGLLMWQLDWEVERQRLLDELCRGYSL